MARAFYGISLILLLGACNPEDDYGTSSETEPTAEFEINPLDVDTGWPDDSADTGYEGARRRAPDSGWRLQIFE